MRVVAGKAKGKKQQSVPGNATRPILDRVKTALFDILRPVLPQSRVLDLFAGTGAVGIEALSQGAAHCVFTDLCQKAIDTIKSNLAHTGLENAAAVLRRDALTFVKNCRGAFDLIYIAPPQYQGLWIAALHVIDRHPGVLAPQGRIVVQIDPKEYERLALSKFSNWPPHSTR